MPRFSRTAVRPLLALVLVLLGLTAVAAPAQALTGVDLSTYKRVGRFDLPEPTRTAAPANNLLAQEASGVTYDWDTDTLFIVGDGGTSVTQVSKTGALIDTMTLPPGGSPQGTEFYDTEGIAYIGNGEFVMTEERERQAVKFTYVAGGTLTRAAAKTVKLGTSIGNVGLEGLTNDPVTGGYIFVKEIEPTGIFQTGIDWEKGTATNGGPAVVNSTNLFEPSLAGLIDFSDVFALANLSTLTGPQTENLLIISQESGKIVNVNRAGKVSSSLTLVTDPGNPLSIQAQTHEGVTMDNNGVLYSVNESGGGDADHPQLWVFEPTGAANQAPTAVSLANQTTSLPENTNTSTRLKLADVVLTDDGIGTNTYSVTGPDAGFFEAESSGLYLKAGTVLNKAAKASYEVTVKVEDATVSGSTPVPTAPYTLTVTSAAASGDTTLAVTEVSPWSSGNSPYAADWFELTNTGTKTVDLTGWRMDDESASFGAAVTLNGVAALAPGESAIFTEDDPATVTADFKNHWFGGSPPAGFKIGSYTDTGTGLSSGGDQVNIFNPSGTRVTGVAFGPSTSGRTFDNTAALGSATSPVPTITTLSTAGVNGAVTVGGETGSPGVAPVKTPVIVSEVAPWGSSDPTYGADWWELTNKSTQTLDLTGWKIDDESNSFGSAIALNGVSTLAPGESAIFLEGDSTKVAAFKTFWFGSSVPAGLQVGTYSGSGIGLGAGGDQLNVFNAEGNRLTGVKFGSATTNVSFDNAVGIGSFTAPPPTISTLSAEGVNGAFKTHDQVGSPGVTSAPVIPPLPNVKITEVSSTSSSNATYKADWWELTNTGSTTVDPSAWKVDDDSNAFGSALALAGVTSLAPGESAIFIEGTASTAEAFKTFWFGASPPAGFKIGTYSGSGIGFGSGGDQVNLFDSAGTKITGVRFGAATTGVSFDNAAGIGSPTETPPPLISTNSVAGTNGAFTAGGETGSPGTIKNAPPALPNVKITEVSSTSSSNATYKADWWELTNTGSTTVDPSSYKVDDDSSAFASALALAGVTSLAPGESAIFIEGTASTAEAFKTFWFGASPPAGFKIGTYSGSGIGFGSGGDQVNLFDSAGTKITGVRFGAATTGVSFDNAAGIGSPTETPPPLISTLSVAGTNGAFTAGGETGSPGTIKNPAPVQHLHVTLAGTGGGTVTSSPAGINCGSACDANFATGALVKLTGTPNAGSKAVAWSGCDNVAAGQCEVTMSAAKEVTATFDLAPPPPVACTGSNITGEGSSLQLAAHEGIWEPGFQGPGGLCFGKGAEPKVDYKGPGSANGLNAWNFNGTSSTDTSRAFIGTDDAPSSAQIANAETSAGGAKVLVIPVAQTSIAVVINPPPNCSLDEITNKQLENAFRGGVKLWTKFDGAQGSGCAAAPVTRVVRSGTGSGTTYQFKNYLFGANTAKLSCTESPGRSWKELEPISDGSGHPNVDWPENGVGGCKANELSPIARAAGSSGADLVNKVNATEGSIGYAALPDVEANASGDTATLKVQNNGLVKYANAQFAGPKADANEANCLSAQYTVPLGARSGEGGESADWSQVFGGDLNIAKTSGNSDAYSLCTLTYDLAFNGYGKAGFSAGQATTVKGYLGEYVTTSAGQDALAAAEKWYTPLPTGGLAANVLGAAQLAASKIGF